MILPTIAKGLLASTIAALPFAAQVVVDEKMLINVAYVFAAVAAAYTFGGMVTKMRMKQGQHDETLKLLRDHLDKTDMRMNHIEETLTHLPCKNGHCAAKPIES
jgi:hypothetical protein